jgi:hypothetical protein
VKALTLVGLCQARRPGRERVITTQPGVVGEEAVFCLAVILDRTVAEDVPDASAQADEMPPDQNAAMAFERLVFGAEKRHSAFPCEIENFRHGTEKSRSLRHSFVVGMTISQQRWVGRPSAQCGAHEQILNP